MITMDNCQSNNKCPGFNAEAIKAKVIDWLLASHRDIIIGNEVMYGSSRKVVDLLAIIDNKTIAVEIKSSSDRLSRLLDQIKEYRKVFDKTIIITSPSHLNSIKKLVTDGIGLYVIDKTIKRIQPAATNRNWDKLEVLNSISSSFLKKLYPQHKTLNENEIRLILSKEKKVVIHQLLLSFYKQRLSEKNKLFLSDRGDQTLVDDIPALSTLTLIDEL